MTGNTPLDAAHAAMEAAPGDGRARLAFYDRLAAAELFVLLEGEATGGHVRPRLFEAEGQSFVLAFDREERLADFAGGAAPYVALSGRAVAGMLAPEGLGLALNPGAGPSEALLPAEAMAWLAETLAPDPGETQARLRELHPPRGLSEAVLSGLDARLAAAAGLARCAYLVEAVYDSGARAHLLGVIGAVPGAEPALARMVSDLVQLSGQEALAIDVAFFDAAAPVAERLAGVGLRFDLPAPEFGPAPAAPPGSDPDTPPRLR